MQRVSEQYNDQDFMILAVNTTFQDDERSARQFDQDLGLTLTILFDTDGTVTNTYRVSAMPTSYFIDRYGIIREVVIGGPMAEALLISRVQQLSESSIMPGP